MECTACGAALAPHDPACAACGVPVGAALADARDSEALDGAPAGADVGDDEAAAGGGTATDGADVDNGEAAADTADVDDGATIDDGATVDDGDSLGTWRNQPTQAMPAVQLPDALSHEPQTMAQPIGLAPPLDAEFVVPPPRSGGAHRGGSAVLIGALLGAVGVLAIGLVAAIAVLALGGLDGLRTLEPPAGALTAPATDPAATATPAEGEAEADAEETEPPATADGSFNCATQQLAAPESGRWTLHRAQFGTRAQFDYLTLLLRRSGRDDGTASVRAEVMAPDEVGARYGIQAPSGDAALVLVFDGPVRIPGDFGGRPGHRALQEFRIVRNDGTVHAVVGVNGSGCFALSGSDWQAGQMPNRTEITLRIER